MVRSMIHFPYWIGRNYKAQKLQNYQVVFWPLGLFLMVEGLNGLKNLYPKAYVDHLEPGTRFIADWSLLADTPWLYNAIVVDLS